MKFKKPLIRQYPVHLAAFGLLIVSMVIFWTIIRDSEIPSDLNSHITFAYDAYFGDGYWPRHFLYFGLVALSSFWTETQALWETSGWVWLSVLTVAKFYSTIWFANRYALDNEGPVANQDPGFPNQQIVISFCLIFVFCFPQPAAYQLGLWYSYSFPPNVWHNSTHIALMPIAIILFALSVQQLKYSVTFKRSILIGVVAVLSAFAKPSYLMAWVPAFGLVIFVQFLANRNIRRFMINILPLVFSLAVVVVQYVLIYSQNINNTSIDIGYMAAWLSRADRLPSHFYLSIFFSSFFPMIFYIFHFRCIKKLEHQLAIYSAVVGYLFAMLFSESGAQSAGNFMWPIIPANFMLYMVCIFDLVKIWYADDTRNPGSYPIGVVLPALIFVASTAWGFAYLWRYVILHNFG